VRNIIYKDLMSPIGDVYNYKSNIY